MTFNTKTLAARMLAMTPDAKALKVGTVTVKVPRDDHTTLIQTESDQSLKVREIAVIVADGSVTLTRNGTVTYDGTSYTVRDVLTQENGDLLRVHLVETSP